MTASSLFRVRVVSLRAWQVHGSLEDARSLALALSRGYPAYWVDATNPDGEIVARIEPRRLADHDQLSL